MRGFGGETKETGHLQDLEAEGRIILKHILKQTDWLGVDRIYLDMEREVTGSCERGNEPSGSVKLQELLLHTHTHTHTQNLPFLLDLVSQPGIWPTEFFHSTT
jgi:hypothetical protein